MRKVSKFGTWHNCLFGFNCIQYTNECGEMYSPYVGIYMGICGEDARETKTLPGRGGNVVFARLDQTQFGGPFNGRAAIIDVKFTIYALGMCADRAQGDHEFTGDFGSRKVGLE
jgi:hypothetical protein